ncbi:hypothetical protein N7490_012192 [Penicillium lividum]|nr:hypothetical protein N7490_012192 [Penicillium lividum]
MPLWMEPASLSFEAWFHRHGCGYPMPEIYPEGLLMGHFDACLVAMWIFCSGDEMEALTFNTASLTPHLACKQAVAAVCAMPGSKTWVKRLYPFQNDLPYREYKMQPSHPLCPDTSAERLHQNDGKGIDAPCQSVGLGASRNDGQGAAVTGDFG